MARNFILVYRMFQMKERMRDKLPMETDASLYGMEESSHSPEGASFDNELYLVPRGGKREEEGIPGQDVMKAL